MKSIFGIILAILGILVLVVGFAAFEAWIVMLLWNYVLCAIFTSIPTITFWLAWGILILFNILFKSVVTIKSK